MRKREQTEQQEYQGGNMKKEGKEYIEEEVKRGRGGRKDIVSTLACFNFASAEVGAGSKEVKDGRMERMTERK
jgi:hypothetical protein